MRAVRAEIAAVLALLAVALLVRLPTLEQPLGEAHNFRQTQTAYTAVVFHDEGVDLLHPKLPVFGEPFEVPFEFPLFQAMAAGVMSWGVAPDVALRATGLACFLLSAALLFGLIRHVAGRLAALATLAAFLFSPFSLLWSRASLIEYLAVAGALGWLWAGLLWRERRRLVLAGVALAAGLVAMLVKPTTAVFWILPLLAYPVVDEGRGWRAWLRARRDPVLLALIVLPLLAAAAWTHHADAIKAAQPATRFLTSTALQEWNFGTLEQRLDFANWSTIGQRIGTTLTGVPAWLLLVAPLIGLRTPQARFWAAFAAVPSLTIFVFWNLYVVHDYYLAALTPVLAALLGFGATRLCRHLSAGAPRRVMAGLATASLIGFPVIGAPYFKPAYADVDPIASLPELKELEASTTPGDRVMFEGYEWSPAVPFYARRQGFMIRSDPSVGEAEAGSRLAENGYRVLVTTGLRTGFAADAIRARPWTGVLGRHVYVTGDHPADLRGAPVAATDDPLSTDGTPMLLSTPVTITCGGTGLTLPTATRGTTLELAADTRRSAKLSVTSAYGDVPVRRFVMVTAGAGDGSLTVSCRDTASVTVVGVYATDLSGLSG